MKRRPWILSSLLLWVALGTAVWVGHADAPQWSARLLDLSSSYGQEVWKYDAGYIDQDRTSVLNHIQNQTTNYYGAVGLRVTLKIEIYNVQTPDASAGDEYHASASLATTRGDLSAYVRRESSTSRIFFLDFDLDGANNADPSGKTPPPVEPGFKEVRVSVLRQITGTSPLEKLGEKSLYFSYEIPASTVTVAPYAGLSYLQAVPDSIYRLWNDIGWDRSVLMVTRPVEEGTPLLLDYQFSTDAAGQRVELWGYYAERGVSTNTPAGPVPAPAPNLPYIPGISDNQTVQQVLKNTDRLVVVSARMLASGAADATGRVTFQTDGANLLTVRPQGAASGLIVVAPLLVSNFNAAACPGDCAGGSQFRVGATELVVPVTSQNALVDRYELLDDSMTASGLPDPIKEIAQQANALSVYVRDLAGFGPTESRSGDAWALVPDVRNAAPLSGSQLSPSQRENQPPETNYLLSGNLPVGPIQTQRVSYYRVLALLYSSSDQFYALTYGDRGYVLELASDPALVPPGEGGVQITISSRTTNYDAQTEEAGFELSVLFQISLVDSGSNTTKTVTLKEAGTHTEFFPVTSAQAGQVTVSVASTSGDVTPRDRDIGVPFVEKSAKAGISNKIPGLDPVALVAALGAVALALGRRRL